MQIHVACTKCGKTCANKSQLVFVLLLIGRESGVRFFSQSQSIVMRDQSNCKITWHSIENLSNVVSLFIVGFCLLAHLFICHLFWFRCFAVSLFVVVFLCLFAHLFAFIHSFTHLFIHLFIYLLTVPQVQWCRCILKVCWKVSYTHSLLYVWLPFTLSIWFWDKALFTLFRYVVLLTFLGL